MPNYVRSLLVLVFLFTAAPALAAEQPPAAAKESKQSKEKADGKQTAPAKAPAGPKLVEFRRVLKEWKPLLAELHTLRIQYRAASPAQRREIEKKWKDLVDQGNAMERRLLDAAKAAYLESPNTDPEVGELMVALLGDRVFSDDDEVAFALGELLMKHKCPDPRVPGMTGMAAFAIEDFDAAEKYLKQAQELNSKDAQSRALLEKIPAAKAAWADEQKLRAAEAKANDLPRVLLKTSQGDIELELFENEAPNTVANFITLVEKGFYSRLTFHRVLPGFMAQGGCPKGDGSGGPGYSIAEEYSKPNHRLHFRGSLSMARTEDPNSAGSQFFLMFMPKSELDGKYTVFGRMTKGFEVLAKIQRRDPTKSDLVVPDKIIEAKVLRKRDHKYEVKKIEP